MRPSRPRAVSVSRDGVDEELLQRRNAVLVRAGRARELEELVAMVEREQEELGPRRARRGLAMQPRQLLVAVRPRNALCVLAR